MRYVILRDDDTNAFTPVECLERLYRPFLNRGLPVNLAAIPDVTTAAKMADGRPEGFLSRRDSLRPVYWSTDPPGRSELVTSASQTASSALPDQHGQAPSPRSTVPLGANTALTAYLKSNPGYRLVQHGCHHDYLEFDHASQDEVVRRLEHGSRTLQEAGFAKPQTFVAPYDKLSRPALREVKRRFRILSTGWFELRRLPRLWWPKYALKKIRHRPHWQVGKTLLLSHPGCLLSCQRAYSTMIGGIIHYLETQQLTVLVTHWWEYFRDGKPDEAFIDFLHETASYIATHPQLRVISFDDLIHQSIPLN